MLGNVAASGFARDGAAGEGANAWPGYHASGHCAGGTWHMIPTEIIQNS